MPSNMTAHNCSEAMQEWANDFKAPYAVTLTYSDKGHRSLFETSRQIISNIREDRIRGALNKHFSLFFSKLNRTAFGRASRRYGLKVKCLPVIEGDGVYKRHHFHLCIDKPHFLSEERFKKMINELWTHGNVDFVKNDGDQWVNYILKVCSKDYSRDLIYQDSVLIDFISTK